MSTGTTASHDHEEPERPAPGTPAPDSPGHTSPSRRHLLRAGAGTGLAAGALLAATAPAQARTPEAAPAARAWPTLAALLDRSPHGLTDGEHALTSGYRTPGDGGGTLLRWDSGASETPDGGLVHTPSARPRRGRWRQVHDGTVDFRTFGVLGPRTPADDALDAMAADPSVTRVQARTDLLFRRRHTFTRSRLTLDFTGHTVHTGGIARNTHDNPFGAVFAFTGTTDPDRAVTHALTARVPELTDVYPVPDSGAFAVGEWWSVTCAPVPGGGQYERELQKLVEITEIPDDRHIRVGYLSGWELPAGRELTWVPVRPVHSVTVRDLVFLGAGEDTGAKDDEYTGSHPVSFEYAVDCHARDIHATGTFWPVVMRRWNTRFTTARCSLKNPPTVEYGGAGYLTQQIYCLDGRVSDCASSNVRHLSDLTASAHCQVVNCHGDGDDSGGNPFTTHGQYEHDLLYQGNSGLMDIANSGAPWGTSAKRITVRDHVCSWFVADTKITDLTLDNVTVLARPTFDQAGTLSVNADGAQLRGCTAVTFSLTRRSSRSARPTTLTDCHFAPPAKSVLVHSAVDTPVHLTRCVLDGLDGNTFAGTSTVTLTACTLRGSGPEAVPLTVTCPELRLTDSVLHDTGLVLDAPAGTQRLSLTGSTRLDGDNAGHTFLTTGPHRPADAATHWHLGALRSTAPATTAHAVLTTGVHHWRALGAELKGGRLRLEPAAFRGDSTLVHAHCTEDGVTREAVPEEGPRVRWTANLLL
ncbi:peptidase C14 [Streptomyces sp. CLI2509]|uniref:peptidase C14 n=2 Tax=unclassified Streptomyces TaxID=2593676 RepID=UPI000BAC7B29|nr:peptidase C14 [Streptomyces sp. CLI2509]